jgi:hypothetical protein
VIAAAQPSADPPGLVHQGIEFVVGADVELAASKSPTFSVI